MLAQFHWQGGKKRRHRDTKSITIRKKESHRLCDGQWTIRLKEHFLLSSPSAVEKHESSTLISWRAFALQKLSRQMKRTMTASIRLFVLTALMPLALALLPHSFWSGRSALRNHRECRNKRTTTSQRSITKAQIKMYFDDCERHPFVEEWEPWLPDLSDKRAWIASRAAEKKGAMEQLLGYTYASASAMSVDQIEEETLRWAVDCNVIWVDEEEPEEVSNTKKSAPKTTITSRYSAISDLLVASDCRTTVDSLAFLWNLMAKLFDHQELNSVYMVVFPNVSAMWEYDDMVTVLQALAISKPLLPVHMQHIQLDLFHPDYKHSPRMWSPEMHSPFPTLGLSIQSKPATVETHAASEKSADDKVSHELTLDEELEATRARLEALFDRIDAGDRVNARPQESNMESKQILDECQKWATSSGVLKDTLNMKWIVDSHTEPFQLYNRLWSSIRDLQVVSQDGAASTTMLVAPNLDAHTTMRLAITVNAALQRLGSPIRVVDVFHPNSPKSTARNAPHAMIQLMYETTANTAST